VEASGSAAPDSFDPRLGELLSFCMLPLALAVPEDDVTGLVTGPPSEHT
jgi:hypothetical protein